LIVTGSCHHRRTRRWAADPGFEKFQGKRNLLKNTECKNILNTVKIFKATLFLRASATCSKILNDKRYIFITVNSGPTLLFRASATSSKTLDGKKHIQYSENFQGKLCFSGQAQVAQNAKRLNNSKQMTKP